MNFSPKPNLGYADAEQAITFLVEVLGFELHVKYSGPGEHNIAYAELKWPGGGRVAIHTASRNNSVRDLCGSHAATSGYPGFSIHLDVQDPDRLFEKVAASGAEIVMPLSDSPMGTRGFVVKDPEGLYWSFGTPLPRLVKDENGKWRPA